MAIIAGGSRGIGELAIVFVRAFVHHGALVVVADINNAGGHALGPHVCTYIHCDVAEEADVRRTRRSEHAGAAWLPGRAVQQRRGAGQAGSQTRAAKSIGPSKPASSPACCVRQRAGRRPRREAHDPCHGAPPRREHCVCGERGGRARRPRSARPSGAHQERRLRARGARHPRTADRDEERVAGEREEEEEDGGVNDMWDPRSPTFFKKNWYS